MSDLKIFSNAEFGEVRVAAGPNDEPWFVASDVAKILGYENPAEAVRDHCKKVNKITQASESPGKPPLNFNIIPESDVYRLIMRSHLPGAERFQDWVVEDVLPSLRKRGGYTVPSTEAGDVPVRDDVLFLVRELREERKKNERLMEGYSNHMERLISLLYASRAVSLGVFSRMLRKSDIHADKGVLSMILYDEGLLVYNGKRLFPSRLAVTRQLLDPDPPCRITGRGQRFLMDKLWRFRAADHSL
jgi:prophage antirepressor-like protein